MRIIRVHIDCDGPDRTVSEALTDLRASVVWLWELGNANHAYRETATISDS